jgi:hypothetical protein
MLPVDFEQRNAVLGKPEFMTDEQCMSLPVHRHLDQNGYPQVISCWQFSKEDLEEIQRTGRIWMQQLGTTVAPFALFTEDPFEIR